MHAEQDELDEARALVAGSPPDHAETRQWDHCSSSSASWSISVSETGLLEVVRASQSRRAVFLRDAAVVALEGDLIAAADLVATDGSRDTIESQLRFRGGQQLFAAGGRAEGELELERALAFYRTVDASRLRRADRERARRRSERVGVAEREAVGHAGDVVDDLVDVVAALDEVVEDRADRPRAPSRARAPPAARGTRART